MRSLTAPELRGYAAPLRAPATDQANRPRRRRLAAAILLSALALAGLAASDPTPAVAPAESAEIRGLWVVRTSLTSPASIARLVRQARDASFNTLIVQVRGRGDAYYASRLEPRAAALSRQPDGFDPLDDLLRAVRGTGLSVHAWVGVNLVASAVDLPAAPTHVVNRHPEWLMVPRALAADLPATRPDRAHVARLARWTRTQSSEVEGLYTSPIVTAAAAHVAAVVADLVRRYPVQGVHLDYVRYPRDDFDYSPLALREFRASLDADLTPQERRRLDARARRESLVFTDMFPARWEAFRRSRLTSLVMRVRTAIRAEKPDVLLSAAVVPDPGEGAARRLQDWALWAQNGLLDVACPMAYTTDGPTFARQVADAVRVAGPVPVWAGIGAYRLAPGQTLAHIQAARRAGAAGFVLFSYDSMTDPAQPTNYLEQVGRGAFDAPATVNPTR
jgi:uncharacterized lipoprotein YddW (UPF0748 family)